MCPKLDTLPFVLRCCPESPENTTDETDYMLTRSPNCTIYPCLSNICYKLQCAALLGTHWVFLKTDTVYLWPAFKDLHRRHGETGMVGFGISTVSAYFPLFGCWASGFMWSSGYCGFSTILSVLNEGQYSSCNIPCLTHYSCWVVLLWMRFLFPLS